MQCSIAIIANTYAELKVLTKSWSRQKVLVGSRAATALQKESTVAIASGYGRTAVIETTRAIIEAFRPLLVVSAGFADAIVVHDAVHSFVVPEEVLDTHTGERFKALAGAGLLATVAGRVNFFQDVFSFAGIDMASSIVGKVAHEAGVPMVAVKILVSDGQSVDFRPHDWLNEEGEPTNVKGLVRFLMTPRLWHPVVHRRLCMISAVPKLTQKLNHLIEHGTFEGVDIQKALATRHSQLRISD